jgi:hypothetical protein
MVVDVDVLLAELVREGASWRCDFKEQPWTSLDGEAAKDVSAMYNTPPPPGVDDDGRGFVVLGPINRDPSQGELDKPVFESFDNESVASRLTTMLSFVPVLQTLRATSRRVIILVVYRGVRFGPCVVRAGGVDGGIRTSDNRLAPNGTIFYRCASSIKRIVPSAVEAAQFVLKRFFERDRPPRLLVDVLPPRAAVDQVTQLLRSLPGLRDLSLPLRAPLPGVRFVVLAALGSTPVSSGAKDFEALDPAVVERVALPFSATAVLVLSPTPAKALQVPHGGSSATVSGLVSASTLPAMCEGREYANSNVQYSCPQAAGLPPKFDRSRVFFSRVEVDHPDEASSDLVPTRTLARMLASSATVCVVLARRWDEEHFLRRWLAWWQAKLIMLQKVYEPEFTRSALFPVFVVENADSQFDVNASGAVIGVTSLQQFSQLCAARPSSTACTRARSRGGVAGRSGDRVVPLSAPTDAAAVAIVTGEKSVVDLPDEVVRAARRLRVDVVGATGDSVAASVREEAVLSDEERGEALRRFLCGQEPARWSILHLLSERDIVRPLVSAVESRARDLRSAAGGYGVDLHASQLSGCTTALRQLALVASRWAVVVFADASSAPLLRDDVGVAKWKELLYSLRRAAGESVRIVVVDDCAGVPSVPQREGVLLVRATRHAQHFLDVAAMYENRRAAGAQSLHLGGGLSDQEAQSWFAFCRDRLCITLSEADMRDVRHFASALLSVLAYPGRHVPLAQLVVEEVLRARYGRALVHLALLGVHDVPLLVQPCDVGSDVLTIGHCPLVRVEADGSVSIPHAAVCRGIVSLVSHGNRSLRVPQPADMFAPGGLPLVDTDAAAVVALLAEGDQGRDWPWDANDDACLVVPWLHKLFELLWRRGQTFLPEIMANSAVHLLFFEHSWTEARVRWFKLVPRGECRRVLEHIEQQVAATDTTAPGAPPIAALHARVSVCVLRELTGDAKGAQERARSLVRPVCAANIAHLVIQVLCVLTRSESTAESDCDTLMSCAKTSTARIVDALTDAEARLREARQRWAAGKHP